MASTSDKYYTKVQLEWVPIPEVLIKRLGWEDGAELELVPIYGDQIVVRRKGALSDAEVPIKNT